ncbi:hypothetical protein CsSME_00053187 [Camellia sinensis var. sinensis]
MGSSQAAMSFLTNLARAAFGLGLGATVLNSSLYMSTVANVPSSSIDFEPISSSHGSRDPTFSTSELVPTPSRPSPAPKISKWSTSLFVFSLAPRSLNSPESSKP